MRFRRSIATERKAFAPAPATREPFFFRHPWIALVLILGFAGGVLYLIYGLPSWRITKLQVQGQYTLSLGDLRSVTLNQTHGRWFGLFHQDSLWAFDTHAYEQRMRERWIFSSLEVRKKMPNTLVVELTEEQPAFTVSLNGQFFGIDRSGTLSNTLPAQPPNTPVLQFDVTPTDTALGNRIIDPSVASFMQTIITQISARHDPNLVIQGVRLPQAPDPSVNIFMAGDWYIIFDRTQSIDEQLRAFYLAYDQKIKGTHVQYVDVSVPDRVYVK